MASSSSSADESGRKRKRDSATDGEQGPSSQPPSKWRTRRARETYSSKLYDALRLVRTGTSLAPARGSSRWSRAILARRRVRLPRASAAPPPPPPAASSRSAQPALARKARVLGRLVPGCRKLAFPALLAEVSDYIAALEMQVRAMNDIAQALSSVSAPGGSSPSTSRSS
ncbi:transcription factor bHLH148-like [Phragmites australis]|uniref:transcription factor bHLH148-like n=1 Tax=Phragmites australis TaxID=29695 RepID=UPI002D76559E|nr:transcription factor bHLH148-like [Phragmites australis]